MLCFNREPGPDQDQVCRLMAEHLAGLALGELGAVVEGGVVGTQFLESGSRRNKDVCFLAGHAVRGFLRNCEVGASRGGC